MRLNSDEVNSLQELAEQAGWPASTLVRSWIIDRIRAGSSSDDIRKIIYDEVETAVRDALKTA